MTESKIRAIQEKLMDGEPLNDDEAMFWECFQDELRAEIKAELEAEEDSDE